MLRLKRDLYCTSVAAFGESLAHDKVWGSQNHAFIHAEPGLILG